MKHKAELGKICVVNGTEQHKYTNRFSPTLNYQSRGCDEQSGNDMEVRFMQKNLNTLLRITCRVSVAVWMQYMDSDTNTRE